ncbi:MAG TPA: hypothetical protein VHE35_21715 [Kofleriaceae bacterium]|nr:hypothetical protein [Kofleriaceae bacterium]
MKSYTYLGALLAGVLGACHGDHGGVVSVLDSGITDAAPPIPIDAAVTVPPFRNPVNLSDLTLARAAAERLGVGDRVACDQCHGLTTGQFQDWLADTHTADACLTNLHPTTQAEAQQILDCFRAGPGEAYSPHKLGIYATGASLGWFRAVVEIAYGGEWAPKFADWTTNVLMPRNQPDLLTQDEFDIVAEWFARGLPDLDQVLTENPPPGDCTPDIEPDVAAHTTDMQTAGWRALNRDANLAMFGCAGAATPLDCLATYPLATTMPWGMGWGDAQPTTKLRILYQYSYNSSYWTRSSPDGRFVAHGGGPQGGSSIIDLQLDRRIQAQAMYDPGFFPDDSGFVFQGSAHPWCRMNVLTAGPQSVTFNEPDCSSVNVVGLYQHVGAVQGGDYWAVAGEFVSDNGNGEPAANFGTTSESQLTPMIWTGTAYQPRPEINVQTPNEGDMVISPSATLLMGRTASASGQNGFTLHALRATPNGNSYTVSTPMIGRYCVRGGKPAFSYDERWVVYHHWVEPADFMDLGFASANDPAFTALVSAGTSNIYLMDLTTGTSTRITNMAAGQRALFPHFRSDGWIYFVVKHVPAAGSEVVAASDAALVFEQ